MSGNSNSSTAIFFALGANFSIFVAKIAAAIFTGSGAMMAEAVHSLADCGNQILLLIGIRKARKPASSEHPLGHGKAIYFWSFLVALLLFSMGGMFSLYEGIHKLQTPEALRGPWIAVGVLVFGVIAESFSMWGCMREVNKLRGSQPVWKWFHESRESELLVIFGEDLAALLGLALALAAVLLTIITGNPLFDALGTIAIGVLLIVIAIFIAIEVKALLIGQSASPARQAEIRAFLDERPEIESVLNLITLQMGPDIMLAVKAQIVVNDQTPDLVASINRVEADLKARFTDVRWSFFEPDVSD